MKKTYSTPSIDVVLLNTSGSLMDGNPVNPFSDTTSTYDSNSTNMDVEDEEFDLTPEINLWN